MFVLKPHIFKEFPEIIFGFSTKIGAGRKSPYFFNTSHSVGDDEKTVDENRELLYQYLGLNSEKVAWQRQIHSDIITFVNNGGVCGESDALITNKKELGLAVSVADCTPIFIYDKMNHIISVVHSGWRGTEKKILLKTLEKLNNEFSSNPAELIVYIGPSISLANYEVGPEVAEKFDKNYLIPKENKFLLDVAQVNYDILVKFGVKKCNIQKSELCTFEMHEFLHSYRRDGKFSGRSLGIIALKNTG